MSSRNLAILSLIAASLVGGTAVAAPPGVASIALQPGVIAEVEGACIPVGPRWVGEAGFLATWEAVRQGELCRGYGHMFNLHRVSDRGGAEQCLQARVDASGSLLYQKMPAEDPPGTEPVLSGELPRWKRGFGTIADADPADPKRVVHALAGEALALFQVDRVNEGLEAFAAAYRFVRILGRGQYSNRDHGLVTYAIGLRRMLDHKLWMHLRPATHHNPDVTPAPLDVIPASARPAIQDLLLRDRALAVEVGVYVTRDLDFRTCAITYVDRRLSLLGTIGSALWGDGQFQVEELRERWAEADLPAAAEIEAMHPVIALFLPSWSRLKRAQEKTTKSRQRLLAVVLN